MPVRGLTIPSSGPAYGGPLKSNVSNLNMDAQEARAIVGRYVNEWNATKRDPMWVTLATPGDQGNVPGVTFGDQGSAHAGMELPIRANLIVLNKAMLPGSLLSTFLHEYGHALYRVAHSDVFDPIQSEVFAIRYSLQALETEGLQWLALDEAAAVARMASDEPYASAVAKLRDDPFWQKYASRPSGG